MNDAAAAWLAGIFEGEGCITICRQPGHTGVCLVIGMTDKDIIDRVNLLFPSTNTDRVEHRNHGHKDLYRWRLTKGARIREFFALVAPWLGERRTARMQEAIAFLDSRPGAGSHQRSKTHCPSGHLYEGENLYITPAGKRVCRECQRVAGRKSMQKRRALGRVA